LRTLDTVVAAGYAVLCISLITLMSPYGAVAGGATAGADARASVAVEGYVEAVGLAFLSSAPPTLFCSSLAASGNSTVVLGGSLGGYACGPPPAAFEGSSSVSFALQGRQVEIEAWIEEA
jgi:hypothetical protein